MSRIGRKPVVIPAGVTVTVEGNTIQVKGPMGTLKDTFHQNVSVKVEGNEIIVERHSEENFDKALHGLTRAIINNMVDGVVKGFVKELEINGVGYRAEMRGKDHLILNVGFSHEVDMPLPQGITCEVPAQNKIIIKGSDKQVVGEFAAKVRSVRPPEPYKGKGIKYVNEFVRRKEGKTGAAKK